jgi:hypothetical protein
MNYDELHKYLNKCKSFKRALPRAFIAQDIYFGKEILVNKGTTGKLNICTWGIYFVSDGTKEETFLHKEIIFKYIHCPSLEIIHS